MKLSHDPLARVQAVLAHTPVAMAYDGGDFADWQARARAQLTALLGMDRMETCDLNPTIEAQEQTPGYTQYTFHFQSEPGYDTPCCLLVPPGAGPFPLAVCLQGHSKGMHISLGQARYPGDAESIAGGRDFALQAIAHGYCALTVEQRGMGLCGGDENGPHCYVHTMGNLLLGRTTIGERIWDIRRAIDAVSRLFEQADTKNVLCMGNSGGGTAAFYASCVLPEITRTIASCSVCTFGDSIMAMEHCSCNFIPHIRQYFDMGDLAGLIAPRPLVIVAGREDPIFPLPGVLESYRTVQALYRAAGAPDACALAIGEGGHRFYPDLAWEAAAQTGRSR